MTLHDSLIDTARADFEAAKVLASVNHFPQSLFYLQQTFEKILKSLYVSSRINHDKIAEEEVDDELREKFGHKNRDMSAQLFDILFPILHKLRKVPDQKEQDENTKTILEFRKARVLEDALMKDYSKMAKEVYDVYVNLASANDTVSKRSAMLLSVLSVCLYGIETMSRYPLAKYKYLNIKELSRTENSIACGCIIQLVAEFLGYYDALDKLFATGNAS